jgi:hypothetical protein
MKHIVEYDCECETCGGTGLYVGMGERDGFAVVCNCCDGTGKRHVKIEYKDFEKRKKRKGIVRVLETNPGIGVGLGKNREYSEDSFGGISYKDWLNGKKFVRGTEMRRFVCPCQWYQNADYDKKPEWDECIACGSFSACKHFPNKSKCWERIDNEHKD